MYAKKKIAFFANHKKIVNTLKQDNTITTILINAYLVNLSIDVVSLRVYVTEQFQFMRLLSTDFSFILILS